jgi:hypothetical protein
MAKTINADFQAAPFLGESSFDPVKFVEKTNLLEYQQKLKRQDQTKRETVAGLKELELDLKGLYDQQGIDEVLGDNERIRKTALEIQRKGVNVFSPTTPQGIKANLAVTKALDETKKKVDVMRTNKEDTELIFKLRQADEKLPEEQRIYDWEETAKNLQKIKQNPGSILETSGQLKNALVLNPTMGNVDKIVEENKEYIRKVGVDPVTNLPDKKQLAEQKLDMVKLFKSGKLKPEHLRALQKEKDRFAELNPDTDADIMSLQDFFVEQYTTKDYVKKSKPTQGKAAAADSNNTKVNSGGIGLNMTPGTHGTNDKWEGGINFNNRYDFAAKTTPMVVNSHGGKQYITRPEEGESTGWKPIDGSGGVEATLQYVDLNSNSAVFRSKADANLPYVDNDVTFSVPIENIENWDKFKIVLDDGKIGTLKDIIPKAEVGVNSVLKKKKAY